MILSNKEIVERIQEECFLIEGLPSLNPTDNHFNTSAVDLRLGTEIAIPHVRSHGSIDLLRTHEGVAKFLATHSDKRTLNDDQPFHLKPNTFILANTFEKVDFPLIENGTCYSARVEGKSSLARCGILVHFTAPTIHAGFRGPITLEIINLGPFEFVMRTKMSICQLIIEEVRGKPDNVSNQFRDQDTVTGLKHSLALKE